jgi:hypothetical protein
MEKSSRPSCLQHPPDFERGSRRERRNSEPNIRFGRHRSRGLARTPFTSLRIRESRRSSLWSRSECRNFQAFLGRTGSFSIVSTATSPFMFMFDEIGTTPSSGWCRSNLRGIMGSAHESSTRSVVSLSSIKGPLSRHGMSTAVSVESRIDRVSVTEDTITAHLVDGRVISVPLAWSWRLSEATPAQRAHWELIGDGHGVHWPEIDEDLSAEGMLNGVPAHRPERARPVESAPADTALPPTSRARRKAKSRKRPRTARG